MKKLNALDISIIIGVIVASVLFGVLYAHTVLGSSQEMQITLIMTENTDAAKYIKIGDVVWISDQNSVLGTVASVKSQDGGGIAITVKADVYSNNGISKADGVTLKLGKTYPFYTKRILGSAVCDSIVGGQK